MKRDCDILIIGGGIAGLAAAVTASNQNLKTILIEKQSAIGGKAAPVSQKGFTFDPGPSICIMKWVYEDLFRSTGADIADYLKFDKLDPVFSLIPENGKSVTLPSGKADFLKKIKQYAPSDVPGFEKLFALGEKLYPVVKKTFFSRSYSSALELADPRLLRFLEHFVLINSYKHIIDSWFKNPAIKAWLYSFPTYTGQTYRSVAPGALLIPYIMICEGVYTPEKGIGSIPKALAKRASQLGTKIMTKTAVTSINHQNKNIISAELSDGSIIYPKAVISAIDKFQTDKLLNINTSPTPSYSYVSLQIGINKKINRLTHHTACIPDDYENYYSDLYEKRVFPKNPILYIHTPSATDPDCAPDNCESLFVVIPAYASGENWPDIEKNLTNQVLNLLKKYRLDIQKKDIIFQRIQTPDYFASTHGNYLGSLFGPDESKRIARILPPGIKSKNFRNLAYCGGGFQPGAGMPMVTLSGQFAANYISKNI